MGINATKEVLYQRKIPGLQKQIEGLRSAHLKNVIRLDKIRKHIFDGKLARYSDNKQTKYI